MWKKNQQEKVCNEKKFNVGIAAGTINRFFIQTVQNPVIVKLKVNIQNP